MEVSSKTDGNIFLSSSMCIVKFGWEAQRKNNSTEVEGGGGSPVPLTFPSTCRPPVPQHLLLSKCAQPGFHHIHSAVFPPLQKWARATISQRNRATIIWQLSVPTLNGFYSYIFTDNYQVAFLFAKYKGYSKIIRHFQALKQTQFAQEIISKLWSSLSNMDVGTDCCLVWLAKNSRVGPITLGSVGIISYC